jgi:2-polyprenyl-3-methyl-5-hydroxy-6-metoxy-1,4-benzoquinol methylase
MGNILCPICKIDNSKFQFIKNDYEVVKCNECNLIYVNPQPDDDLINQYYNENYGEFYICSPHKMKSKFRDSKRNINRLLKLNKLPNAKFLDVGCSWGYTVKTAQDYGWDATGIDLSKKAINFAKDNFEINVHLADIFQIEKQNYYDFITMYDVIEHIKDPVKYLKKVYSLLNNGGHLIIGTPDAGHYKAKNKSWSDYIPPEHLFYFNPNTLRRICEMAGFVFVKKYIRSPVRATFKMVFLKSIPQ